MTTISFNYFNLKIIIEKVKVNLCLLLLSKKKFESNELIIHFDKTKSIFTNFYALKVKKYFLNFIVILKREGFVHFKIS